MFGEMWRERETESRRFIQITERQKMRLVELPSGKLANLDNFVTMSPVNEGCNAVRFVDGIATVSEADATALYYHLKHDAEWLPVPNWYRVNTDEHIQPMDAEHIKHGMA